MTSRSPFFAFRRVVPQGGEGVERPSAEVEYLARAEVRAVARHANPQWTCLRTRSGGWADWFDLVVDQPIESLRGVLELPEDARVVESAERADGAPTPESLAQQLEAAQIELTTAHSSIKRLEGELWVSEDRRTRAEDRADNACTESRSLREQLETALSGARGLHDDLAKSRGQNTQLKRDLSKTQRHAEEVRCQLAKARNELEDVDRQRRAACSQRDKATERAAKFEQALKGLLAEQARHGVSVADLVGGGLSVAGQQGGELAVVQDSAPLLHRVGQHLTEGSSARLALKVLLLAIVSCAVGYLVG